MSKSEPVAYGAKETTAQVVCREMGLVHCFADPGPALRKKLGIRDVHEVKLEGFYKGWSSERIGAELRKTHQERERYWLKQIDALAAWPVLFVCAPEQFEPFATLLSAAEFEVVEVCPDWKPGSPTPRRPLAGP